MTSHAPATPVAPLLVLVAAEFLGCHGRRGFARKKALDTLAEIEQHLQNKTSSYCKQY